MCVRPAPAETKRLMIAELKYEKFNLAVELPIFLIIVVREEAGERERLKGECFGRFASDAIAVILFRRN